MERGSQGDKSGRTLHWPYHIHSTFTDLPFRTQAGWVGKGKPAQTPAGEHQSKPLASLKDPDSFGPPPKNVNFHGGAAASSPTVPARRGFGAPVGAQEQQMTESERRRQDEAAKKPDPPPVPYRVNTTGLDTSNLPKPPARRVGQEGIQQTPSPASAKPKPSLPPRLPPRQNSRPDLHTPDPPPPYAAATQQQPLPHKDDFNVGALNRLTRAGVSVPGLGIGSKPPTNNAEPQQDNPWASQPSHTSPTNTSPTPTQNPSLNGLQSRFSKLSTTSSQPNQGTTMEQKQDALRTATAFHKDPSSISLSDAKATASTANNFRERHGDQVAAGGRWAGAMNKKFDVAGKVNGYTGGSPNVSASQTQASPAQETNASPWANEPSAGYGGSPPPARENTESPATGAFRKPPPPPPHSRSTGPPPVPLGSKPRS